MADIPETLYHYTTQGGLLGLMKSRKIWATNILFLNDSKEFNHTIQLALELLRCDETVIGQDLYKTVEHLFSEPQAPDVYVTSLTSMRDQLSQWRAYCPKLGGFNIGFETEKLQQVAGSQGVALVPCNYDLEEQKRIIRHSINITCDTFNQKADTNYNSVGEFDIDSFLKLGGNTRLNYGLQLLLIAPLFKHPKFIEENEFRFFFYPQKGHLKDVCFREGASTIVPYVEIDLAMKATDPIPVTEIVVGPTPNQELSRKSIEKLLERNGIQACHVTLSEIPYRAW